MNEECRTVERVPVDCIVKYSYEAPVAAPRVTRVLNLSASGARMESGVALIPGAAVSFYIMTADYLVADARARVIYVEPGEHAPFHVGVQFTTISPDDRASIEKEVARRKN